MQKAIDELREENARHDMKTSEIKRRIESLPGGVESLNGNYRVAPLRLDESMPLELSNEMFDDELLGEIRHKRTVIYRRD